MGKIFNTAGVCRPDKHYMVNLDERLGKIEALVDQGAYFTINRARQFGKTTTLRLLRRWLSGRYKLILQLEQMCHGETDLADLSDFISIRAAGYGVGFGAVCGILYGDLW